MRDYKLIAKRQEVEQALTKQNAIIGAIQNGDLTKAEFLTGQQLIPTNPVVEGLLKKKKSKEVTNREILNELRAIKEKPEIDYDRLRVDFGDQSAIEDVTEEGAVAEESVLIAPDKDFDADNFQTLRDLKLRKPSDLRDLENIEKALSTAKEYADQDNVKYSDRGILPKNPTKRAEREENIRIKYVLRKYIKRLETMQEGLKLQTGKSIMTNMVDLVDRFKLLVGEIESGNTNKALKNELADILQYLFRNKKLTKTQYKMFSNLIQ